MQVDAINRLVAVLRKFPGVGQKTALRYAYRILEMSEDEASDFIDAIEEVKTSVHLCKECGTYTDKEVCDRCQSGDRKTICVVTDPKDIAVFEKSGAYNGVFHVLHGALDIQKGIGVENLRIKELLDRLDGVEEVIIATNTDVTGQMTASYIANLIKPLKIKVTKLASGIPMGSDIEYADEYTITQAIRDRKEI